MANLVQLTVEGISHAQAGRIKEAEERFRLLVQLSPNPTARILLASLLPPIYQSMEDLRGWRQRLEQGIGELVRQGVRHDVTESYAVPEFFAQYQGLDDKRLQESRAKLYSAPQHSDWGRKRARAAGERIRVGIVSKYLRDHTIGRLAQGLVAQLPRGEFHLTLLSVAPGRDEVADFFKKHCDQFLPVPNSLPQARKMIADLKLDVIYYLDLGMDPVTYTLALSRLAPVQCATWGHPVTSGISAVDYFISAQGLEPDGSQGQFTEKLVTLKDLAVYYYRPVLEAPQAGVSASADRFGLPADANLYGCPQSLYKFHPEFDAVLGGILRADAKGILVLLAAPYKEWMQALWQRFNRTMPDVLGRIRFIPRQDRQGFLRLNAACDVLLDPLHFGGGNTTYEALAMGTPVITLPSGMLRGRLAFKMYQTIGLMDFVAKDAVDYVRLAAGLGMDRERRRLAKEKILAACPVLFENQAGVAQLAEFWKSVVG
jgi:predicted O-linked N-acetylglucosamine transferase (SPINDLY family)